MKKRYKENLFLLFSFLMFLASLLFYIPSGQTLEPIKITAFLTDYTGGFEYTMLKQGMEQAAVDYDAELTFLTVRSNETTTEILRSIEKEIGSQTKAILLQPKDKKLLGEKLKTMQDNISIYFVNSMIHIEEPFPVIATDNFKLGEKLAERILATNVQKKPILILKENFEYTETYDYYQGIIDKLNAVPIPYEIREIRGEKKEQQMKQLLEKKEYEGIVTFTSSMLELASKVKNDETRSNLRLFGFQKSNAALALIDNGTVEAIGLSNQFAVGYQAVQQIFTSNDELQNSIEIQQIIVDQTNLFSEENQKLLFPVVQ